MSVRKVLGSFALAKMIFGEQMLSCLTAQYICIRRIVQQMYAMRVRIERTVVFFWHTISWNMISAELPIRSFAGAAAPNSCVMPHSILKIIC